MAGEKLKLVKKTVEFLVNQMRATDKLGVVEYDSSVNELVALSKTDPLFKAEASRIIRTMTDGSCTNLSGGLFKGVEQQQKNQYVDWTTVSVNRAHDAPVEEEEEEQEEEDEEEEEGIMQQMVQNLAGPPSGSPVVQQANVQQTLDLLAEEQDVQQADDAGEEQDVAAEDGSDDDSHRGNGGGGLAGMFGRMMRALRSPLGSSARAPPPVQQQQQDPSQGAAARVSRRSQRRLHMVSRLRGWWRAFEGRHVNEPTRIDIECKRRRGAASGKAPARWLVFGIFF